ncbi:hypothetical protein U9M48_037632 [Paspalum notatum var. saurae]|uniref:Uncharacterized protein n=1 Tax=Paspalum notatum var. saurae TaxID=547442 RepID=A0AAQ3ULM0_PASNO
MDSVDDWVVLDSCTSSSDDDRVIALSSGSTTPGGSTSASDTDTDSPSTTTNKLLLATALASDDADGLYALSDAEDDYAYPPPSPPLPSPLSGLFHHTKSAAVAYAAFNPAPSAAASHAHHAAKLLVPDPTFAAFFSEPVRALASTRGLVCLRGARSAAYYVANPATFARAQLPRPHRDHTKFGDPAVVIAFDDDLDDPSAVLAHSASANHPRPFYRHYHVVVAFPVGGGIYAFEAFSSRTWGWTIGEPVAAAETVVPGSGVGALGCAFWRTTMGFFLCYQPASGCADLVPAPAEVTHWPRWELGEMDGALCAVCMGDRAGAGLAEVLVVRIDFAARDGSGGIGWTLVGHFEGGCLRGRSGVEPLRAQGKPEVVMWDPMAERVVAMDLEGRTTRTINFVPGSGYHDDFIPYVCSLAGISGSGPNTLIGLKFSVAFLSTGTCLCKVPLFGYLVTSNQLVIIAMGHLLIVGLLLLMVRRAMPLGAETY